MHRPGAHARIAEPSSMRYEPLSDQAVMVHCDDEDQAIHLAAQVRQLNPAWLVDVVQAYVSVAIFYELAQSDYFQVQSWLNHTLPSVMSVPQPTVGRTHV